MFETKAQNKHNYAYSVAFVRTLETMLLSENEIERMILAKNATEAIKILNEFDYADNTEGVENPADFQKIINHGLVEIKDMLDKASPDKNVMNIIWFQYDFHNIKTMMKAKLSGKSFADIEVLMSKMGKIGIDKLKTFIFDETNTAFDLDSKIEAHIKEKIRRVETLFHEEKDNPQVIDLYLDQKLMKVMYKTAQYSKNSFLINYVKTLIDLTNIKLFFRMKSQEKDAHLFEMALLWNGHIDYKKFINAYSKKLSEFPEIMAATKYSEIVQNGYKHYEKEENFMVLEKEIENHLIDSIKGAKLIAFGPEPLVAYFLAKKNNALIIRMIMIHKLNNIEPEEIKNRLRKLYI